MAYTQIQIDAAKENAKLHGHSASTVSDKLAIDFLDWYHTAECRNCERQELFWAKRIR